MLEDSPNSISFATGGYIYMTFGLNTIKAYLDTLEIHQCSVIPLRQLTEASLSGE